MNTARALRSYFHERKVLVTGHTGFKGSWLCALLHSLGAEVTGFALQTPRPGTHFSQLGIERGLPAYYGDVCSFEDVTEAIRLFTPEIIYHLAAKPTVRAGYMDPLNTFRTNIIGTAVVLQSALAAQSVRAIVCVTSDKCYPGNSNHHIETESVGGTDPLSASKASAELVIGAYSERTFREFRQSTFREALGIASARASNVIGGGDWTPGRLVPDIVRAIHERNEIVLRSPSSIRAWQHVLDAVVGYAILGQRLAERPEEFAGPYNFGPRDNAYWSTQSVAEGIVNSWPARASLIRHAPSSLTEEQVIRIDSSKAIRKLHLTEVWTTADTIDRTAFWYRKFLEGTPAAELTFRQIEEYLDAQP